LNLIRVDTPPTPPSIEAVRTAIDRALEKHPENAKRVRISIVNGTVTLTGQVPSWVERTAVEEAVHGTKGVVRVDDQLRIQL
jgi:osmotically-inducible protein OsmY